MSIRRPHYWTADRIIDAIRGWAVEHGEHPKAQDWARVSVTTPATPTVLQMFGTWNAAMEAAGFIGRPAYAPGTRPRWNRDSIADAFLDFVAREGRWPTTTDCGAPRPNGRFFAPGLPDWRTVSRHFGSFTAAKRFAGWNGVRTRQFSSARRLAAVEPLTPAPAMRRDFAASTTTREAEAPAGEEEVAA